MKKDIKPTKLFLHYKLRDLRLQSHWTQKELAHKAGTVTMYISQIETGHRRPSLDMIKKFASVFGVELAYFLIEQITFDKNNFISLPIVGCVYAGKPILAQENIEKYISLPKEVVKDGSFILRVNGDSMIDARIFNGDSIIVRQQSTALNGDIVVALIGDNIKHKDLSIKSDDNCALRRFYKRKNYIELRAENSKMDCKPIKARNVVILGKVIGRFGGVV